MSVLINRVEEILNGQLPDEVIGHIVSEYLHIKQQFILNNFLPTELNGGRFGESALRAIEFLDTGKYTAFGTQVPSEQIIRSAANNTTLSETLRLFIPRTLRVIIDVRNKRDVGHPGGDVSPNFSDSLFIVGSCDWVLTEFVRHFYNCSINEASQIVKDINETKIPIVTELNGFIRVNSVSLSTPEKILVILYYKNPTCIQEKDLQKWLRYKNPTNFRKILIAMDKQALIHYENHVCNLLPNGIIKVETQIPTNLIN
jgi:hypothetical protein